MRLVTNTRTGRTRHRRNRLTATFKDSDNFVVESGDNFLRLHIGRAGGEGGFISGSE